MIKYTLVRLLQTLIVLVGVSLVTFVMVNVVPGDPVALMMEKRADPETMARVRKEMGLDKPLTVQYLTLAKNALRGDFGTSYFARKPVGEMLLKGFKVTSVIGGMVILFSSFWGILLGVSAAVARGKPADKIIMFFSTLGMAAPSFWIAILLQIVFGLKLMWFPISGLRSTDSYVLPILSLALIYTASIARLSRTNMLDALNQDYIRTARAKGVSELKVNLKHGLKNAAVPIITYIGIQIKWALGGSVLIETVFSINGLGKLMIDAVMTRDIPVIQGCTIYIAVVFVVANLIIDLLYGLLDPRVRVAKEA
ncbi:MAG TPA: ABC transporter permease [Holophaga sp.]|nr:ABC transporter permease [Holophaga sp.]HPS67378.1 ABC transporter permease [Holophaga sp.]